VWGRGRTGLSYLAGWEGSVRCDERGERDVRGVVERLDNSGEVGSE
jgi:hypothetical protein